MQFRFDVYDLLEREIIGWICLLKYSWKRYFFNIRGCFVVHINEIECRFNELILWDQKKVVFIHGELDYV